MCIFSQPVAEVGATKIFARAEGGTQLLAYEMAFAASGELAMVLPLPVPPSPGDDAVQFIDLSGYASFFRDLDLLYSTMLSLDGAFGAPEQEDLSSTLVVHDVGDFEASFVPRLADFGRLDRRFRVSERVWRALPGYRDWGFAVFKLKGAGRGGLLSRLGLGGSAPTRQVHPMAMRFPTRDPSSLFFPTVHVHDGTLRPRARFDHSLYCQARAAPRPAQGGFLPSPTPVDQYVSIEKSRGLVDPALPVFRMQILGEMENADIVPRL